MTKKQTMILTLIDEAKKGFDATRAEFAELENIYLNTLPPSLLASLKKRRKSHLTPQIVKSKVRRIVIGVMKAYFENDRFAVILPEEENEKNIETVKQLQRALDLWTVKRMNLYSRFKPLVRDALVYGSCFVKVVWDDGLKVRRVKYTDLYLDPNAESPYDVQYVVHRVVTTVGILRKQFGKKFKWRNYIGQYDGNFVSTTDIGDASRVEVMDVYRYENGRWLLSTVLPDQSFIRTDEPLKDGLPFIQGFVDAQFTTQNDFNTVEAYGEPFIEPLGKLQWEWTVARNQQIDAIDKIFNPQYLATKTSGLKEADLESNKKKVLVSDLNQVKEIPLPNIQPSIFNTDKLETEMQEISGITRYSQGLNDKNLNQTATGMSILTEESNAVISDIIRALNESLFEPAIKRMVRLIAKYDESPPLYGIDREALPKLHVSINAGVGAVNNELMLNNINAAIGSVSQAINIFASLQDIERAGAYARTMDELMLQQLKHLKIKTAVAVLKEELDERERNEELSEREAGSGGFAPGGPGDQAIAGLPGNDQPMEGAHE